MKPNPRSLRLLHSVERCGSLLNTGNNPDENKVEVLIIRRICRAMSDPKTLLSVTSHPWQGMKPLPVYLMLERFTCSRGVKAGPETCF